MTVETEEYSSARRRLILRDSATFLILVSVTAVLFAITLFLFRSFMAHRQELAQRWSNRGRAAVAAGHPDQAIMDFRTALSYGSESRPYELLLAQALGDAGHIDESYNYFQGLWETTPGDGFINLRLARLAAKKNNTQEATNYYRAAIYGTWEGDATYRRREARLELARYLISQRDTNNARSELLTTAGNNANDAAFVLTAAGLLEQANAPADALAHYQKVLALQPKNITALESAGRLQYGFGDFAEAYRLLDEAAKERDAASPQAGDINVMRENSRRVLELEPSPKLDERERVRRILKMRDIAKKRVDSCGAQIVSSDGLASSWKDLQSRWSGREGTINFAALMKDLEGQSAVVALVFDTEKQAAIPCGAPTGDDAALLLLARSQQAMER